MRRLLTLPGGRRAKWVVLGVWLLVFLAAFPLSSRFEDAQKNEADSFLPGGTDSLIAFQLGKQFTRGELSPAVLVARRESGLTDADRDAVTNALARVQAHPPPGLNTVPQAIISPDGKATVAVIPIVVEDGDSDGLLDAVRGVRCAINGTAYQYAGEATTGIGRTAPDCTTGDLAPGLTTKIGGPGGFSADAIKVFSNINGTLFVATLGLVFVLLILIYRSPIFWTIPLFTVLIAETTVRGLGYLLTQAGVTVNAQSAGIMLVLVFGAGTDYALLLVSRYREELHHHADKHDAIRIAMSSAGPAIFASAGTVICGLLCLLLAQMNGTSGLGAVGALGVGVTAIAMLTLLPALLAIFGRRPFWPLVPKLDAEGAPHTRTGLFRRVGEWIARRPRAVWIGVTVALLAGCVGISAYDDGLTSSNGFRGEVESVDAQKLIGQSFPGGTDIPTEIIVRDRSRTPAVRAALQNLPEVASLGAVQSGPPGDKFDVILRDPPYSRAAYSAVGSLRGAIDRAVGPGVALVGGASALERDARVASARDTKLLPPIVLTVILLILIALLRSFNAPLLLVATVILSFFSSLGISLVAFAHGFDFPGVDPSFPLYVFIFLVALGVDYNIFLMARVREEAILHGTHEGMLRGLAATGAVITSAGIVLAGTFAVLGVLPLIAFAEVGFAVAFGVLLDTLIVRSVLVPALVLDLDRRTWWPSRLSRSATATSEAQAGAIR